MTDPVYFLFPLVYIALNAVSFALYGMDKYKARKEKWRISEQSLLIAAFFGPIGAWMGWYSSGTRRRNPCSGTPCLRLLEFTFYWFSG